MASDIRVSFIVTSRNDDHGGGMLRRFATFADGLLEQANRHELAGELIVVDWNPPPGPRLQEVLTLRQKSDLFAIRFIEVPPAAHRVIRNSDVIPLFQMIAKNVGIRRARGEFVVATNPDVLFSDAVISFLAHGDVRYDTMYRIDRHDVTSDVPEGIGIVGQLAWCSGHVLRVHGRKGTSYGTKKGPLLALCNWAGSFVKRPRLPSMRMFKTWRPWQIQRTIRGLGRRLSVRSMSLRRCGDRLVATQLARAMRKARLLYGPQRQIRNALWLGLNRVLGPPRVHTNGCGDFTLLPRDRWFDLRGYPELPLWSMHIDSFLCYMAVASGLKERVLRPPCMMFHIEHGNSWAVMTPEDRLRTFAAKPWIDSALLGDLWGEAYGTGRPIKFNVENWGLGGWELDETVVLGGEKESTGRILL